MPWIDAPPTSIIFLTIKTLLHERFSRKSSGSYEGVIIIRTLDTTDAREQPERTTR